MEPSREDGRLMMLRQRGIRPAHCVGAPAGVDCLHVNRAGSATNAPAPAPGTEALMHSKPNALVEQLVEKARALKPNQAIFLPGEVAIARTGSGTLRFGGGIPWAPIWYRGDGEELLREHLTMALDWTQSGYYAGQTARELAIPSVTRPVPVQGVGRRSFHVDREAMA